MEAQRDVHQNREGLSFSPSGKALKRMGNTERSWVPWGLSVDPSSFYSLELPAVKAPISLVPSGGRGG